MLLTIARSPGLRLLRIKILVVRKRKRDAVAAINHNSPQRGPSLENLLKELRFIKYWLPVIIYATLIFYLSSIPGQDLPELFASQSTALHIIEYAGFAFLFSRAVKAYHTRLIYNRRFIMVLALSFLYAASDEFHQLFVPLRNCSLYDLAFDGIGILVGSVIYR